MLLVSLPILQTSVIPLAGYRYRQGGRSEFCFKIQSLLRGTLVPACLRISNPGSMFCQRTAWTAHHHCVPLLLPGTWNTRTSTRYRHVHCAICVWRPPIHTIYSAKLARILASQSMDDVLILPVHVFYSSVHLSFYRYMYNTMVSSGSPMHAYCNNIAICHSMLPTQYRYTCVLE